MDNQNAFTSGSWMVMQEDSSGGRGEPRGCVWQVRYSPRRAATYLSAAAGDISLQPVRGGRSGDVHQKKAA